MFSRKRPQSGRHSIIVLFLATFLLFPSQLLAASYHYDHQNQRVLKIDEQGPVYTPNKYFERRGATTTKHIYVGNTIVATIETDEDGNNTKHFVHTDHLGGTHVVSDQDGNVEQTLDYFPYGDPRINESATGFDESNKFTGYELDPTGLQYAGQRYYDGSAGRFNSQDPAHLDIGDPSFEDSYQRSLRQHLSNPQALNSYSYSHNNPIVLKDEEGEVVPLLLAAWAVTEIALSAYDVYDVYKTLSDPNASDADKSLSVSGALIGLGTVGGGYGSIAKTADDVFEYGRRMMRGLKGKSENLLLPEITESTRRLKTNYINSGRVLLRSAEETSALHNFPQHVTDTVLQKGDLKIIRRFWRGGRAHLSNDSFNYTLKGAINGMQGTFEVFTRPSRSGQTELIMHKFFRPNRR